MSNKEELLLAELRFSGETELKIIRDELAISKASNIIEFDGGIQAMLTTATLEKLKERKILIDIISQAKPSIAPELKSAYVYDKNWKQSKLKSTSDWFNSLKIKAEKYYIDDDTNTIKVKVSSSDTDSDQLPANITHFQTWDMLTEASSESETKTNRDGLYLIYLNGPLNTKDRDNLIEHQIKLTSYYDGNEYSYKLLADEKQYEYLEQLDIVKYIRPYGIERKLNEETVEKLSQRRRFAGTRHAQKTFDIVLTDKRHEKKILTVIQSNKHARILAIGSNTIRITANPSAIILAALVSSPYVMALSLYEPPELYCDVSRVTLGLTSSTQPTCPFSGEGETVCVIDSGIDDQHPDLINNLKKSVGFENGTKIDQVGHGTHVAGIIAGDGSASNGKIIGIAPQSSLVSVGVVDQNKQLNLPPDFADLFKIALQNGAKIINLSHGKPVFGNYHLGSFSVDQFIYENPEVLVVVAAGNNGNSKTGNQLAYRTVGSPATAKNALTVGAATTRRSHPQNKQTWGQISPSEFPSKPFNLIQLTSQVDYPSLRSSTGPTDYDSIKPEVLAPGNYILSTKASTTTVLPTAPSFYDKYYTFLTGTSMAAPTVSGIAALVREYLKKVHQCSNPSSALLKAIIIGTGRKIDNNRKSPDNSLSQVGFPDFDQGFGVVDFSTLLHGPKTNLHFIDIYNKDLKALESRAPIGGSVKSFREYILEIESGKNEISITMTWIDPAAMGIQNNLQLSVKTPSNDWLLGNMDHLYKKDPLFDPTFDLRVHDKYNNTEKVVIQNPTAGKYLIRVTAQNTLSKQGYSLALIGDIKSFEDKS